MKALYPFRFGCLLVEEENGVLTRLSVVPSEKMPTESERLSAYNGRNAFTDRVADEVRAFLAGERTELLLPFRKNGTEFQRRVWRVLSAIPYGETRTYKQIAVALGYPNACRAVGAACKSNPLLFVVPCHRVVGADGGPCGYAGGLALKEFLLKLECASARQNVK